MAEPDSGQLLREYAERRAEQAFSELVRQHINLVYSVALRGVGENKALAEDVVQVVFVDLARQATRISTNQPVVGWLYRHTCYVASKARRSESRRKACESKVLEMNAPESQPELEGFWQQMKPVLDATLNRSLDIKQFTAKEPTDPPAKGTRLEDIENPERTVIFRDRQGVKLPDGRMTTVLFFADGHAGFFHKNDSADPPSGVSSPTPPGIDPATGEPAPAHPE